MSLLPDITVCGQIDFSRVAFDCNKSDSHFDKILSIWDKDKNYEDYTQQKFSHSDIEFIYFDDDLKSATASDIEKCLEWGRNLALDSKVLIHCHAGISRSTAITLGVLYGIYEDIDSCIQELVRIRPQAQPNLHITELIDRSLQLKGDLLRAVKSTFYTYARNS